jgi:hypothetical protein
VGQLPGLKKEKEMGYQGSLGRKGNWVAGIEFKFPFQFFWFKSNSFKHFQTNFELDSK